MDYFRCEVGELVHLMNRQDTRRAEYEDRPQCVGELPELGLDRNEACLTHIATRRGIKNSFEKMSAIWIHVA